LFNFFKLAFQRMPHLFANGDLRWFQNTFGTISPRRFYKCIPTFVSTLFLSCTRSHPMLDYTFLGWFVS
jgi:hypothetical protein